MNRDMDPGKESMHDKCKQVIMFHNILTKFFKSLKGVLHECRAVLRQAIAVYKSTDRKVYLEQIHTLMTPHIQRIAEFDECIFSSDYQDGPLYLLPDMDFKIVFDLLAECDMDEPLRKQTQRSIFNHVQNIYIATEAALTQVSAFNRNLAKQKEFLIGMLENLNLDDKLKERVEALKKEEDDAAGPGLMAGLGDMLSPEKLNELLGGDNFMIQLAQEVAGELDFGAADINNPTSALMSLFADNGKKFQELVVTIGDKIQNKVQSGEIDSEKLMRDAQLMKDKFKGAFGNIPGIKDLLNGSAITQQFQAQYNAMSPEDQEVHRDIPGILEKQMTEWTEEDKKNFEGFTTHVGPPKMPDMSSMAGMPGMAGMLSGMFGKK